METPYKCSVWEEIPPPSEMWFRMLMALSVEREERQGRQSERCGPHTESSYVLEAVLIKMSQPSHRLPVS